MNNDRERVSLIPKSQTRVDGDGNAPAGPPGAPFALRRRSLAAPTADSRDETLPPKAMLPQDSIGRVANALARPAFDQLRRMTEKDPGQQALYSARALDVRKHYAGLSAGQLAALACARAFDTLVFWRRWLNEMIHPATQDTRPIVMDDEPGKELVACRLAKRVHFFTRDHALLDGLLLGPQDDQPLPVLVMALGNGMRYETLTDLALQLTTRHQVRVLLYNDRGIGRSLGHQYSTGQAVRDCRAAMQAGLALSDGTIDVFGISLGGGKTAVALRQAQAARELTADNVRTYVNCHSFTSLAQCIGQLMGVAVGFVSRALFVVSGIDNLDALSALKGRPLAKRTVVFTATHDAIMRGAARLSVGLQGQELPGDVVFREIAGGHNCFDDYFDPDSAHLQAWIDEAAVAADKALP